MTCKILSNPWMVIGVALVIITFTAMGDNILGPFYPEEADKRGVSQGKYGFVIGAFELAAMLFSLPLGMFMSYMDVRLVFMMGLFLLGGSSLLFGCLEFIDTSGYFAVYSFLIRIVQSVGQISVNVAIVCILQMKYPQIATSVTAWAETGFGFGMIVGPFIGGILYDMGGFSLPFTFLGCALILSIIPGMFLLTVDANVVVENHSGSFEKTIAILKLPKIWLGVLANIIGVTAGGSFLQSTLEPHLRRFHLSGTFVGLTFLLNGLGYICMNPFWGIISDRGVSPYIQIIVAGMIVIAGLGMLGPMPWIPVHPKLSLAVIGLILTGIGTGGHFIPSLAQMIDVCKEKGIPYDTHTKGVITGLWLAAFNVGGFIGPSFGGLISNRVGFRMLSFICMLMDAILVLVCIPFYAYEKKQPAKGKVCEKNGATTPLLLSESKV